MPPAGPQPPKSDGPNVAFIVLIAIVVVVVSSLGGCLMCLYIGGRSSSSSHPTASTPSTTSGGGDTTSASSTWITSERPYVKFLSPPGWRKDLKGDWGLFTAPDGAAVFAFTTFNQPGESTARLGKAAWVLGVSDIAWGNPEWGTVGHDHFNAHMGEGSCNYQGPGGYIWYATVDSGSSDQILLIYAVSPRGTKAHKDAALTAIRSLQRR